MNEQELGLVVFLFLLWSRVSARRRLSRFWFGALAATFLPYDRAGRLLPQSMNRTSDWWEEDVMLMSESQFREHFRFRRSVFYQLLSDLQLPNRYNGLPRNKYLELNYIVLLQEIPCVT